MTEMVTVGGVRYRKEDAARENLTADSKAHAKKVAEGAAPVGVSENAFKADAKAGGRKAAGTAGGSTPAPTGTGGTETTGDASNGAGS